MDKSRKSFAAGLDENKKFQYEKMVKDKTGTSYQLTEMTEELIEELSYEKILNIILSNEAEMAYVSGMLLRLRLPMTWNSVTEEDGLCL